MQYNFYASLRIDGRTYPKGGPHEVSEEVECHPHFIKYVNADLISEAKKKRISAVPSVKEKNKALIERLVKQNSERRAKIAAERDKRQNDAKEASKEEVDLENDEMFGTEIANAKEKKKKKARKAG